MRHAVIGKGFIYPRHENAIKATGGELLFTCDIDVDKDPDFLDWRRMFEDKDFLEQVDAVSICTPNYTHSEIAVEALKLGKKVLCEKPLCIDPRDIKFLDGVNTVLQLRYNPEVKRLKKELTGGDYIFVNVKTFREAQYWNSWKGKPEQSGGILYNMGVHYIDLLIHLLGNPQEIITCKNSLTKATGIVRFERGIGRYHIELLSENEDTVRELTVNGKMLELEGATIPLSGKNEIKRQDLHTEVYKHFIEGDGIPLEEARKSLELVAKLYEENGR